MIFWLPLFGGIICTRVSEALVAALPVPVEPGPSATLAEEPEAVTPTLTGRPALGARWPFITLEKMSISTGLNW